MEAPTTPPPSMTRFGRARTPPSPTHGPMHEVYEPYSPRRSTRNVGNPYSSANITGSKPAATSELSSPPASPGVPTNNTRDSLLGTPRRNHNKAAASALAAPDTSSSTLKHPHMLPTPTKTPTMNPSRKHHRTVSVENSARILHFQPENPNDVMPPRRNKYKHKFLRATSMHGLDLDDDLAEPKRPTNSSFEIYAESHARVPQVDDTEDNPFYRPRATTAPPSRAPTRETRRSAEQLAEEQEMNEAAARDEGIIYMFRGKKVFRKFRDSNSDSEVDARDLGTTASQRALKRSAGATAERPLTRSSAKPRLLFPTAARPLDTDEEAETDVEMSDVPLHAGESTPFATTATPTKHKGRASQMSTPSGTTRKGPAGHVPIYLDEAPEPMPVQPSASLPTPQRSSRKRRVDINLVPSFAGEPTSIDDDTGVEVTPPRSSRKRQSVLQLSPVLEDEPEPVSGISSSSSAGQRNTKSPFDSWPRTKKRGGGPVESSSLGKRTRSGAS